MKTAKLLAWICFAAITFALFQGFVFGNFFEDGSELMSNPWGIVALIDLYAGFILFAIWIVYKEPSVFKAVLWIVLLMIFGFFIGSIYVLKALYFSDGTIESALLKPHDLET
jgi:hypothetical protein